MKKNKKKKFVLIIIFLVSLFLISGITYGKYVYNSVFDYYLKSKGFYFYSDSLDLDSKRNVNNLWEGQDIEFTVTNSINTELVTTYNINYNVVCTIEGNASNYFDCNVNNGNSNTYNGVLSSSSMCVSNDGTDVSSLHELECEQNGYTWKGQISVGNIKFNLVQKQSGYTSSDFSVNITASSISPYTKTISGNFLLHKINNEEKINLDYKNYSDYDRLIISNSYLVEKEVVISWNSDVYRINLSDESQVVSYDSDKFINSIRFIVPSKNSISYKFYKNDFSHQYSNSDFTVSIQD